MTTKAYRARVARSKANLANELAELANENPDLEVREFVDLARRRLSCPVTETYAEELLRDAQAVARGRRP